MASNRVVNDTVQYLLSYLLDCIIFIAEFASRENIKTVKTERWQKHKIAKFSSIFFGGEVKANITKSQIIETDWLELWVYIPLDTK